MVILAVEIKTRFQKKIKVMVFFQNQAWRVAMHPGNTCAGSEAAGSWHSGKFLVKRYRAGNK